MLFTGVGAPLRQAEVAAPTPGAGQVLLDVHACGVCRTDLHIVDGELARAEAAARPRPPDRRHGERARRRRHPLRRRAAGRRSVARLDVRRAAATAVSGRENLCDSARFTGYTIDGGYAEYDGRRRALLLPDPRRATPTSQAAPLLCAGLIGYRALRLAGDAERARPLRLRRGRPHHLPGRARTGAARLRLHARRATRRARRFARALGAEWAGASDERPPEPLDAAIIFAPVGRARARRRSPRSRKGGTVVCAGIHMSDIPAFSVRPALGGAHRPVGREPHARATARSSCSSLRRSRCRRRSRSSH